MHLIMQVLDLIITAGIPFTDSRLPLLFSVRKVNPAAMQQLHQVIPVAEDLVSHKLLADMCCWHKTESNPEAREPKLIRNMREHSYQTMTRDDTGLPYGFDFRKSRITRWSPANPTSEFPSCACCMEFCALLGHIIACYCQMSSCTIHRHVNLTLCGAGCAWFVYATGYEIHAWDAT